ncbi:MAG: hypothetical protein ACR2NV_13155 [Thermoleophilaceae bacterium]
MNVLLVMRTPGHARNFESTLRLMAERGHRVHVGLEAQSRAPSQWSALERLSAEHPEITYGSAPRRRDLWAAMARDLRLSLDFLSYFHPRYEDARGFREWTARHAPAAIRRLAGWPLLRTRRGRAGLAAALGRLERAVPTDPEIDAFLTERRPDLLLVTPVTEFGTPQSDYLRGARRLGIRTGICIYSWDNLTTGGRIRDVPDLVTVWNGYQHEEAVELHGIPEARIVATGAQAWDHWFAWTPSRERQAFCEEVGLRADRPVVLFVGSSPYVRDEVGYVTEWIARLRERGGALGEAGILIRPHPQGADRWAGFALSAVENVAVWPAGGADPIGPQAKVDYFDSIHHCAAVVGVNTTAFVESAVVGRPVLSWLAPGFRDSQEGMLHFRYLLESEGGPLTVTPSFEEHADQLARALGGEFDAERNRAFVRRFVRPHGLEEPATPRLVSAIEGAGAGPAPAPRSDSAETRALRTVVAPVAAGWSLWADRARTVKRVRRRVRRTRRWQRRTVSRAAERVMR